MEGNKFAVSGSTGNTDSDLPPHSTTNADPQAMTAPTENSSMNSAALALVQFAGNRSGQGAGGSSGVDRFGKKRRGRGRRYNAVGNLSRSPLMPGSGFQGNASRGSPLGSGDSFVNTVGSDFTPHLILANTGEDVTRKITSFVQMDRRGICVISANGSVSNVELLQTGSSGNILTYEGRFEIVTLSGSFSVTDAGNGRSRVGGLSVSLAGPDGRVIGGKVAGKLIAGSPIQIMVGSFMPDASRIPRRRNRRGSAPAPASAGAPGSTSGTAPDPVSQANPEAGDGFSTPVQAAQQPNNIASDSEAARNSSAESAGWSNLSELVPIDDLPPVQKTPE